MNIAIILEATLGGIRKHVVDLITNLSSEYKITFIYSMTRADEHFKKDIQVLKKSFDCIELPMSNVLYHPSNFYSVLKMIRIFKSKKIQLIHAHGAVAGALGRAAAFLCSGIRKIIYSPHGGVLHKIGTSFSGKLYVKLEKLLNSRKVFFIAVSFDEKEKIRKYFEISEERIWLIPNGIDLEEFNRKEFTIEEIQQERRRLGFANEDFVLLYPALFLEAKGHQFFFSTIIKNELTLNPKVKIILAGDGPLKRDVELMVGNTVFGGQVLFLGFVQNINLYFQLSNAVILPSINEAFGYVLLEAMANSKMIFATAVGGIKDIVQHGVNGFLYDVNNLTLMIEDINHYAKDKEELSKFEENSIKIINDRFALSKTITQIEQIYR